LDELRVSPLGGFLRRKYVPILALAAVFLAGCPKANQDLDEGRKAEAMQDYDTALVHYERALRADPSNAEYKLRATRMRFEDGQFHLEQGKKALDKGDLQLALAEFQKAQAIDPSNEAADQEVKKTIDLITAKGVAQTSSMVNPNVVDDEDLLSAPPVLKPLSHDPINLKMVNQAKTVFETIAKLAGVSVIFDPTFNSRQISADLPNVTLEQALDDVSLESQAFWKPLSSNVIFVAPDNPQKRRDVEDQEVRVFYLSNTLTPQDLTEIVTGMRQLYDMRRIMPVNGQNAIVIRDTPDKIALAQKLINDLDKAKPEVLIHVQVLSADVDRLRDLGILPGQSVSVAFTPRSALQPTTPSSSTSTTTATSLAQVTLNNLRRLSTADWSITLPGAQANAILTDNDTKIIQDPEVRTTDGLKASLKIGERVPVATGSFQAGVGVGTTSVSPLVNTQFQYLDVGVTVEVTPRVHPEGDVSMHLNVVISAVASTANIGGINQPVISQTTEEGDVSLKDGEASILGGLIETDVIKNVNGIPGASQVPIFRYLFSDNSKEVKNNEVLIVITPHVIRFPSITADNLRTIASGTDTEARVYRDDTNSTPTPPQQPMPAAPAIPAPPPQVNPQQSAAPAAQLHFDPANASLNVGDSATIGVSVSNVSNLYSIPLLIHYNPAVIRVEEVRDGGFLSGGNQQIAIVQRIDEQRGEIIVSATRQPNTPGVSGSGTLLGLVVRGVAPGNAGLQILQVNARDAQQKLIPMVSGVATIQVK
jgi:general secretion pathway protein D